MMQASQVKFNENSWAKFSFWLTITFHVIESNGSNGENVAQCTNISAQISHTKFVKEESCETKIEYETH